MSLSYDVRLLTNRSSSLVSLPWHYITDEAKTYPLLGLKVMKPEMRATQPRARRSE